LRKSFRKRRPATGRMGVCLLNDNAPAHTWTIVKDFWQKRNWKSFLILYSHDLAPAGYFQDSKESFQVGNIEAEVP
jgi:hypothetical protein